MRDVCTDERRDPHVVCVVEDPRDIVAVERTRQFRGRYHVLQGSLNPLEGVGPDQLRVKELLARVEDEEVTEVILCTNPNLEGEATAMYLARLLAPLGVTCHPDRQRSPGGRRPRVRRRADPGAGPGGATDARTLTNRSGLRSRRRRVFQKV